VVVFGGGSFGTALAYAVARQSHRVVILTRKQAVVDSINNDHKNPLYVTDFLLPPNISAVTDIDSAMDGVDFIIHAVPVQISPEYLRSIKDKIPPNTPIICSSKGIHTENLDTMNEIIARIFGQNYPVAFISGPSFAKEILADVPTGVVIASCNLGLANRVKSLFQHSTFKVWITDDVIGVEIGGALKNVFAIASGICTGMGLGLNSKAALVTRGCGEMTKIALSRGARAETLAGLSGMGDLVLTCFGSLSRNQTVGLRLGAGETIAAITASMSEVAEGVATTPAAARLAQECGIDAPIIQTVDKLLKGSITCDKALELLMGLPVNFESPYILQHKYQRSGDRLQNASNVLVLEDS